MSIPRFIAFYLPQYFPTKENDEWWQKGFTEWLNVGRAKPLFKGHYQPKVPTDLGYYDLRISEVRDEQANLAREAGIEGFCYWHYWFAGQRLLDRVFTEVVRDKKPDFPFCLCWANHSWSRKRWDSKYKDKILMEQTYPGVEDYITHFNAMISAFQDSRYIRVNGRLLFGIYAPTDIPDFQLMKNTWNDLAKKNGLDGFHFFCFTYEKDKIDYLLKLGFDSVSFDYMLAAHYDFKNAKFFRRVLTKIKKVLNRPIPFLYKNYVEYVKKYYVEQNSVWSCIIPNFDHSPRSGTRHVIIHDCKPSYWKTLCEFIIRRNANRNGQENIVFVKSWNEWGEGNYMEPDIKYGKGYISSLREAIEGAKRI